MEGSGPSKFDLRTLQRDDENLPSLATLQSGDEVLGGTRIHLAWWFQVTRLRAWWTYSRTDQNYRVWKPSSRMRTWVVEERRAGPSNPSSPGTDREETCGWWGLTGLWRRTESHRRGGTSRLSRWWDHLSLLTNQTHRDVQRSIFIVITIRTFVGVKYTVKFSRDII